MPLVRRSSCSAFTIAIGKPIFIEMAFALARSFLRWNGGGEIGFTLVTDRPVAARPPDLAAIDWVQIETDQFGIGFTPKLYLDRLAPADRSLFIDADCLCVRSLAPAFESFGGRAVSVIGRMIDSGEWFGNVEEITQRLGVPALPRFNGGVYYLERGEKATAVYETARELLPRYDDLGFVRLRGKENDEVLVAAAMALRGEHPIPEDGTIMNTLLAAPGGLEIDVLRGEAVLFNPRSHPNHNSWYILEEMRPALVHFLGRDVADHPYRTEVRVLKCKAKGWSDLFARTYGRVTSEFPWRIAERLKRIGRPIYHHFFGVRPIRSAAR